MGTLEPLSKPVVKTDIVLFEGTTTSAGNIGGTTLIDSSLIGENDFLTDVTLYITSGAASLETQAITGFNTVTGTITVGAAFSTQILSGIAYKVLVFKPATAIAANIWELDISAYAGAGFAGTYLKTVYDDWLNGGRLDLILDAIKAETDTHPTLAEIEAGDMATILAETESHPTLAEIEASAVLALKAHLVAGAGDIIPPANKGLWDYLPYLDENISDAKTLTGATIDSIRKSVCLAGDPASSIGKILYEIYINRLTATRAGNLDEINAAALAQGVGSMASNAEVDSLIRWITDHIRAGGSGDLADILAQTEERVAGKDQVLVEAVTTAANAGDVVLTTVTAQPCLIKAVIIHAVTAQTVDLTTCAIYAGTAKVLTLVGPGIATQAALDAIDKQVSETDLGIRLAVGKTITMTRIGTGATALDLVVTIIYKAEVSGGYLN